MNTLNATPLLDREAEIALFEGIESTQVEMLKACLPYLAYRTELYELLSSYAVEIGGVGKISRIDSEDLTEANHLLAQLIEALDVDNEPLVSYLAHELQLGGNVFTMLRARLQKKVDRVVEYNNHLDYLLKFFKVGDYKELKQRVSRLRRVGEGKRDIYAQNAGMDVKSLYNALHTYTLLDNVSKSLKSQGVVDKEARLELLSLILLINRFEAKMSRAKNEVVSHNLRLVVKRSKIFKGRGLDFEDLLQEGNLGLMKAVDKFDLARGVKFATFATWWIDQSIRRAISNTGSTVRIPTHIEELQAKVGASQIKLMYQKNDKATLEDIAVDIKEPLERLESLANTAIYRVGGDTQGSDDMDSVDSVDFSAMVDVDAKSPLEQVEIKSVHDQVRALLRNLDPRNEMIVRLKFGIGDESISWVRK